MTTTWYPIPSDDRLCAVLGRDLPVGRSLAGLPVVWFAGSAVVVSASAWEEGAPLLAYLSGSLSGYVVARDALRVL
jgi:hypothetical protein